LLWRDAVAVSHEPLVVEASPIGDEVPIDTAIDVWFNNPMEHATTEDALVITPNIPGGGTWEWLESDRHLRFLPAELLEPETVYTVEVLRTATDSEGRALATGSAWQFRTSTEVSDVLLAATTATQYLNAISPNPFTHQTTITFSLPEDVHSRLALYDTHGRRVRLLVDDQPGAGHHTASWDGTDDLGRPVAAGVYFVRLQFAERAAVGKVVVRR
jgi:hypothetical protein